MTQIWFFMADQDSLAANTNSIDCAEHNLGLKVNYDKTTIYRIGPLKNLMAKLYTTKMYGWDGPPITVLGLQVDTNTLVMANANIGPLMQKAEAKPTLWKKRPLTLTGRVLIANTLIESLFVYRFSVLPVLPSEKIDSLHRTVWNFVWQGKRPKMHFELLSAPKEQGGLCLIDFRAKHQSLLIQ